MANFKALFLHHMDAEGIQYRDQSEACVKVTFVGQNLAQIPVLVFFEGNEKFAVHLLCCEICNCSRNEMFGLRACNEANAQYGWIKFYMDREGDVIASVDAFLAESTCGRECLELVKRLARTVDDAYWIFTREIWE